MNKAEILELASADRLSAFCDQWERGRHNGDECGCEDCRAVVRKEAK